MTKVSEGSQGSSGSKDEDYAGIAQLVEHDLAKVGVASSSLVSRSSLKDIGVSGCLAERPEEFGALTKRLCSGLQIRLVRFDSGTRLHFLPEPGWWNR